MINVIKDKALLLFFGIICAAGAWLLIAGMGQWFFVLMAVVGGLSFWQRKKNK
ncbi:hypothetical protein [Photobacterium gaetbulicola]|uniref:hypothetical protein n=1 Tax=Photobacterium gaetbulicola TaxID=1295392 RepID=UPI000A4DEF6D|nr:hypothetical protein [Photobacterium gaetbulicola]